MQYSTRIVTGEKQEWIKITSIQEKPKSNHGIRSKADNSMNENPTMIENQGDEQV